VGINAVNKVSAVSQSETVRSPQTGPVLPEKAARPEKVVEADQVPAAPWAPSQSELSQVVDQLNHVMDRLNTRLRFGIYDGTEQLYVQVYDARTREVLKTIPPEKLLALRIRLRQAIGLLLDEDA
jgi:uncharacterized FlaG/YvyC family protein